MSSEKIIAKWAKRWKADEAKPLEAEIADSLPASAAEPKGYMLAEVTAVEQVPWSGTIVKSEGDYMIVKIGVRAGTKQPSKGGRYPEPRELVLKIEPLSTLSERRVAELVRNMKPMPTLAERLVQAEQRKRALTAAMPEAIKRTRELNQALSEIAKSKFNPKKSWR